MSTTVLREKGKIFLPAAIRKKFDLQIGDTLEVQEEHGKIILTPVTRNGQSWYWTKGWQKKVNAALKDAEEGRVSKAYDKLEDALAEAIHPNHPAQYPTAPTA